MSATSAPAAAPVLTTLDNGVRIVSIPLPHLRSASVGVFVRAGSRHEEARLNGISHFLEHMAFKGTARRDVQAINLDAELIGAELNAYTSRDTTAYYMEGLGAHVPAMLEQLADIVLESTFPAHELEREREVILQELTEVEEDPQSVVAQLVDEAAWDRQPLARPVIGTRRSVKRITRADLVAQVQRACVGANLVVAAAGEVRPAEIEALAQRLFGAVPRGEPSPVEPARHVGGLRSNSRVGVSQLYSALAWPLPTMRDGHVPGLLAATVFGGGMSAPLLDEVRERRGLAYHLACQAECSDVHGSFLVDAITQPRQLAQYVGLVGRLLRAQADDGPGATHLERARNQLRVQAVQRQERPFSAIEAAAEQLFVHGRLVSTEEALQRIADVDAAAVRAVFEHMLKAPPAVGIAGRRSGDEDVPALLRQALRG